MEVTRARDESLEIYLPEQATSERLLARIAAEARPLAKTESRRDHPTLKRKANPQGRMRRLPKSTHKRGKRARVCRGAHARQTQTEVHAIWAVQGQKRLDGV